jgi:hypothetical protein
MYTENTGNWSIIAEEPGVPYAQAEVLYPEESCNIIAAF